VGEGPNDRVSRHALAATVVAPVVTLDDAALEHRPTAVEVLPDGAQGELVQSAKGGQIRVGKSSLGHVEVFLMGSVGTSILGRPRPLSAQRRATFAHLNYTLNCEEPD
jgi:hypothetical protein